MDPFASHVLRVLFVLLTPSIFDDEFLSTKSLVLRSKESAKHRARQGQKKSVLHISQDAEDDAAFHGIGDGALSSPRLEEMSKSFTRTVRETLGPNGVWALAVDKVGCPS